MIVVFNPLNSYLINLVNPGPDKKPLTISVVDKYGIRTVNSAIICCMCNCPFKVIVYSFYNFRTLPIYSTTLAKVLFVSIEYIIEKVLMSCNDNYCIIQQSTYVYQIKLEFIASNIYELLVCLNQDSQDLISRPGGNTYRIMISYEISNYLKSK